MVGAMPARSGAIVAPVLNAIKANAATTKKAAVNAPTIFTKISQAAGKLWNNKGVQVGTGLAATGIGFGALNSQTSEVTKPLGEFGGIANFGLIAIIAIVLVIVMVIRK